MKKPQKREQIAHLRMIFKRKVLCNVHYGKKIPHIIISTKIIVYSKTLDDELNFRSGIYESKQKTANPLGRQTKADREMDMARYCGCIK